MKKFLIAVLFFAFAGNGLPQDLFPDKGEVFRDDVIPEIRITIDPESLNAIYANPQSDHEYPAAFSFDNGSAQESIQLVGFRLRGNTSRYSQKKSFKVAFNSFDKKQKFYGLEKMNLNGEHNDPSLARSKICWDLCHELGIPASRSNHVTLYINDVYWGLYINVEHVDEEFVDLRFGNKSGNLYKCLWPASLTWLGDDPDLYKFVNGDRRAYELKTNEEADDYSDLSLFINVLNNTPIEHLYEELPEIFNIQTFLSAMVMDVFTGNWDGPLYNKNNFYLYHNDSTGLFEYIPYDLDNTLGVDWMGVDWTTRDVYNWSSSNDYLPLYERIIAVPEFRAEFTAKFRALLEEYVQNGELEKHILEIRDEISGYIPDDPFYSLDYGYDHEDFMNSYYFTPGQHVKSGLIPYINNRMASALLQLDKINGIHSSAIPEYDFKAFPNPAADFLQVKAPLHSRLLIFSLDGTVINEWTQEANVSRVETGLLSAGCYVLELISPSGVHDKRLVFIDP